MVEEKQVFSYKLEIYYQAIVIYAVTLVVYAIIVGFTGESFEHVLRDQVVYLLALFTLISTVGLIGNIIARRRIEVSHDAVILSSRFHRREIAIRDIMWIRIGKEKKLKVRGVYRVAKLKLRDRHKLLRLRPSLFHPEDRLVEALRQINVQAHKSSHGASST